MDTSNLFKTTGKDKVYNKIKKDKMTGNTVVSNHTESALAGDVFFKYLFPVRGTLSKIVVLIGSTGGHKIDLAVLVSNPDKKRSTAIEFTVAEGKHILDKVQVEEGDIIRIAVSDSAPIEVEDIWISFIYNYK